MTIKSMFPRIPNEQLKLDLPEKRELSLAEIRCMGRLIEMCRIAESIATGKPYEGPTYKS